MKVRTAKRFLQRNRAEIAKRELGIEDELIAKVGNLVWFDLRGVNLSGEDLPPTKYPPEFELDAFGKHVKKCQEVIREHNLKQL